MRTIAVYGAFVFATFAFSPSAFSAMPEDPHQETDRLGTASEIAVAQVAGPFEFPWSIAFLPDESLLVTERAGRLQLVDPVLGTGEIAGLPTVLYHDQAGLLDVAVDPGFAHNGTLYLSYVHGSPESSALRVLKARLDRQNLRLTEQRVIFESTWATMTQLFGGRLAVTRDGHLFLTLGDRWERERAQDLSKHNGKIIRIRTDGSVPGDNPFVALPGARPEIWTYGHRNPQGLALDERTGELWSHEHGPLGGDELNLILPGRNYGWPVITHGLDYSGEPMGEGTAKAGMEQPFHFWTPAIAPSGLAIASTGDLRVFWIGALHGEALVMLQMEDGEIARNEQLLQHDLGRIRDVRISPGGALYFITDSSEGALYRIESTIEQAWKPGSRRHRL